jgi:hypothetical protein
MISVGSDRLREQGDDRQAPTRRIVQFVGRADGVLQRKTIHIATCAPGTIGVALKTLRQSPKTASLKARFILATDGRAARPGGGGAAREH